MEQFSLEKYLENPSRKVVTRSGHNVRILCTDQRGNMPIVAIIEFETLDGVQMFYSDGKNESHREYDLFFADEEELTEFEKAVEKTMPYKIPIDMLKSTSQQLLELARKEIEKENSEFKPKFTYNEKDYSELANKLIEFRNNTPLCSVSYRDGEGRKVILHYEKEILDLVRNEIEKENPYNGKKKQDWLMSINPQPNQYDEGYEDGYSAAKYNQWKPTDKQMEDFRMLLDYNIGVFDYAKFMSVNSLYDDLKKNLFD